MIHYTDEENKRWWNGLSKYDQREIFGKILANANSLGVVRWAEELVTIWENGEVFPSKSLAFLRKWDR